MPPTPARGTGYGDTGTIGRDDRPLAFLVSTTQCARSIKEHMGSAAYSYFFVLEALAPVLETFGTWSLIDHPESRLAFAAMRAEAEGFRPVHLAINPLQDVYLSPALPNIVFPFWEFPDVPARDFGYDTRQNWVRTSRPAALVLAACQFTAEAFRRAGVERPVAVVPIPVVPGAFELPDWSPGHSWTLTCRHEVLTPHPHHRRPHHFRHETPAGPGDVAPAPSPEPESPPGSLRERAWRVARGGFRRAQPWMNQETVGKLVRLKRRVAKAGRMSPGKVAYVVARDGYRNYVRRWLSHEALQRITATKAAALAMVGREPTVVPDPPLPSGLLSLGGDGLTYLTIFNLGDRRKNHIDLLTAFLSAFKDRADVTLVIKLVTNKRVENYEMNVLRHKYLSLGIGHDCRVAVITEYLTESQMDELFRVSTYYVNASHAEGACLPLMRALAGGRPAIAPDHTAMADYMDDRVGFVPRSFPEPTYWPHDPEQRLETSRYRPVWADLRDAYLASADVAENDPERYAAMSRAARARISSYASRPAAAEALRDALALISDAPAGALGWAS